MEDYFMKNVSFYSCPYFYGNCYFVDEKHNEPVIAIIDRKVYVFHKPLYALMDIFVPKDYDKPLAAFRLFNDFFIYIVKKYGQGSSLVDNLGNFWQMEVIYRDSLEGDNIKQTILGRTTYFDGEHNVIKNKFKRLMNYFLEFISLFKKNGSPF